MEQRYRVIHFSQSHGGGSLKTDEASLNWNKSSGYAITINSTVSTEILKREFKRATLWNDQINGGYLLVFSKEGELNVTKSGQGLTPNVRVVSKQLVGYLRNTFGVSNEEKRTVINIGTDIANTDDKMVFRLTRK